jgi:ribonuclease Z
MKLTFLGTSAGKPTRKRNVSALALEIEQDNKWYLFDCGEATQHQILRSRLSGGKLNTIFITHLHGDHYFGLPGLLSTKKLDESAKPLNIYGPKGIKRFLECVMQDLSRAYLGYELTVTEFENRDCFIFDRFTLKVLPLVHSIESFAFYIKENDICNRLDEKKLREAGLEPSPLYGELKKGRSIVFQGKKLEPETFMLEPVTGRSLIIAGDNSRPDILGSYLENIDLLVHECTYTQKTYDNLAKKVLHTTAKDLAEAAEKRHVKNLIATHINPRYENRDNTGIEDIYNEIGKKYKGVFFVANDFDVFHLDRERMANRL